MVEKNPLQKLMAHIFLCLGVVILAFPIYIAFVASTHELQDITSGVIPLLPGDQFFNNYGAIFSGKVKSIGNIDMIQALINSVIMAIGIAVGKIIISLLSAFAIVYFRFPFRMFFFWMIFMTLMLPVEVRIVPTYQVVAYFGMINHYTGLIIPLIASATATFLFRQFFMTVPDELVEAARIDGAGPMQFFWRILLPLSITNIAALFVILFIYGWNQYLWPLLVTNNDSMYTIVITINRMLAVDDASIIEWNMVMGTAILALLPPVLVVLLMQKLFVKGLVDTEK